MSEHKISIHISDADFYLKNADLYDTEISRTGSAYGRFIFTEPPKIVIENTRFINSRITLFEPVGNWVITGNSFTFIRNAQRPNNQLRIN